MKTSLEAAVLAAGAALLAAAHATAQGNFVNFESPVSKGLAVATPAGGGTFVLACNAEDNALVIVDAATAAPIARVPVGQSPASVVYDAARARIYTVNHIGDSVTAIDFPVSGTSATARVAATFFVGDAPTDAVVDPSGLILLLCSGSNELAAFDPISFAEVGREVIQAMNTSGVPAAMQMPWRIAQRSDGALLMLNQRSGSRRPPLLPNIDGVGLDVFERQPAGTYSSVPAVPVAPAGGQPPIAMGTSGMAMALAPDGRLFVVGNDARNDLVGEPVLSQHPAGFVESWLWVSGAPPNQNTIDARDLNDDATGAVVPPPDSASMPTDVVLRIESGRVVTVYVASFSTDRIVQLDVTAGAAATWKRKIWQLAPRPGYAMAGPRSLALVTVANSEFLFVLDRLDSSVRVFPVLATGDLGAQVGLVPLQDPFPLQHRAGQALLYDARLSGTGKVSCASCHIDGRTDGLAWELDEDQGLPGTPIPSRLLDGVTGDDPNVSEWPSVRGPMTTQTLQGLRHHPIEVGGADLAPFLTTEAFYWRAARANFEAFGPAFQNLLGGAALSQDEMTPFREFAFTIMYPPNPEQPLLRVFGGDLGTPGAADGTGALRGLKLFHERALVSPTPPVAGAQIPAGGMTGGRSCVQCHALPTGTNGRITISRGNLSLPSAQQPIKTAQLRGLRQREGTRVPFGYFGTSDFGPGPFIPTVTHPLFHDGFTITANTLIHAQFTPLGDTGHDVSEFVRELDTGVAPMVGLAVSVTNATLGPPTNFAVALAQGQVEAGNCGLVVRRRIGGTTVNLFYNVLRSLYTDPDNPGSTTVVFRGPGSTAAAPDLLPASMGASDVIVFEAVPIGSERRIASPAGVLTVQTNSAPVVTTATTGLVAPPMWQPVLQLGANLTLPSWQGSPTNRPKTVDAATAFHVALAAAGGFGVGSPRTHQPPRRIRVTGSGIQLGAKLELRLPTAWSAPGVRSAYLAATLDLNPVRLSPTEVVFETSATIDPLTIAAMQCGWIAAPGVTEALDGITTPPPPPLDPTNHNVYELRVINEHPSGGAATTVQTSLRLL